MLLATRTNLPTRDQLLAVPAWAWAGGLLGALYVSTANFAGPRLGALLLLTLAVCGAGFGVIGCQGALNASAGLLYPSRCRTTGVGAALGIGRIGSIAGPMIGGYVLALNVPLQQMFFVPLLPLALAMLATVILLMRGVDIRGADGGH